MSDDRLPFDPDLPEPDPTKSYGDTSGWSGSDTSRERAEKADKSGKTHERDDKTIAALGSVGRDGMTWVELAADQDLHHGEASAVLSRLHKDGRMARLMERRTACRVYVLPEYVDGRPTDKYRPNVSRRKVADLLAEIDERIKVNDLAAARRIIYFALEQYK